MKTIAVGLSLAASAVVAGPAMAWGQQHDESTILVSPPASEVGGPIQLAASPSFRGSRTERYEPKARFIVVAEDFTAVDESGADWPGSDEIYAIWTSGGTGARTSVFEDVDTGETKNFRDDERCIYPMQDRTGTDTLLIADDGDRWGCVPGGRSGPIEFRVWLFEHDSESIFLPCDGFLTAGGVPLTGNCEDDLIGYYEFSLSENDLLTTFNFEGSHRAITKTLGGPCGYQPPGKVVGCSDLASGPEYQFRFRITRLDDVAPKSEVVADTSQLIGA